MEDGDRRSEVGGEKFEVKKVRRSEDEETRIRWSEIGEKMEDRFAGKRDG